MSNAETTHTPLTDCVWFWVLLFSATGLLALQVIGPKYAGRQHNVELQYQALQEADRRASSGEQKARLPGEEGTNAPPARGELIIPLWPLSVVLASVCLASAVGLWRERGRQRKTDFAQSPAEQQP